MTQKVFNPLIYSLLACLIAMAVALLVASALRKSIPDAWNRLREFLDAWFSFIPESLRKSISTIVGVGGGFVAIVVLSFVLALLGRIFLPPLSVVADFVSVKNAQWAREHPTEWRKFRKEFERRCAAWEQANPSPAGKAKSDHLPDCKARATVRLLTATEAVTMGSVLMLVAAFLDLRTKRFRKRGQAVLSIGIAVLLSGVLIWSNLTFKHVERTVRNNEKLGAGKAGLPTSLPPGYR